MALVKCQCNSSKKIGIFRACLLQEGSVSLCPNQETLSLTLCGFRELWRGFLHRGTRAGCTGLGSGVTASAPTNRCCAVRLSFALRGGRLWCQCGAQHHHCIPQNCSISTEKLSFSACKRFMGKCCQIFVTVY